jgi:hypothetical protein
MPYKNLEERKKYHNNYQKKRQGRKGGELPNNELIFCLCGCGEKIWKFDGHGRIQKYTNGHNNKNTKHSLEWNEKIKNTLGIKKGWITPINMKIRNSKKYSLWRKIVFQRDNYICQICGKKGGILNADHIKPFALFKEERFNIENGRTLCKSCHLATNTFAGRVTNYQINETI